MPSKNKITLELGLTALVISLTGAIAPANALASLLYATDFAGPARPSTLYTIDPLTGATTLVGAIGFNQCGAMAFNSIGTLFAACNRADASDLPVLISIDPLTGAGTEIGLTGTPGDISDISFRRGDDRLFAYSVTGAQSLYTIDTTTGLATLVGATGLSSSGNGMAFSPDDTLLLSNAQSLYSLNSTNATPVAIAPSTFNFSPLPQITGARVNSMDFQPLTSTLYATVRTGGGSNARTFLGILDPATGVTNIIAPTLDRLDGLAFAPHIQPVPESKGLHFFSAEFLVILGFFSRSVTRNRQKQKFILKKQQLDA